MRRLKFIVLISIFYMPLFCLAQVPDGEQYTDPDDTDAVPIDGGLSLLLAAGVSYGVKKVYDKRKKNVDQDTDREMPI